MKSIALICLCLVSIHNAQANESSNTIFPADDDWATIRLNNGQTGLRWVTRTNTADGSKVETLQHNAVLDVTVSFFKDRVRLDLQSSTGGGFDGSWNDTGVGSAPATTNFFLRRLSLTLSPLKELEVSMGSLGPAYGAGSENSYFDADGYIMGYRAKAVVRGNTLIVTGGYVGGFTTPNVFDRLGQSNDFEYLQAVLTRSIGEIVRASVEYDRIDGADYARAAAQLDVTRWVSFLDSIVIEDMARLSSETPANILAVKLTKKFGALFSGRDLETAVSYSYRTEEMKLLLGDKVFMGQGLRLNLATPNLVKTGRMTLGAYLDYIQSLEDPAEFRAEGGMLVKF